jgi:hypothetical protein
MKELQQLINEWKSEAARLLLKSKTTTDDIKEAGYYAASMRLTMCYTEAELLLKAQQPNSEPSATIAANPMLGEVPLCCMDCERRYDDFGLDVVLLKEQWKLIHPAEQGVLCAQCIVDRAEKLGAIRVDLSIAF